MLVVHPKTLAILVVSILVLVVVQPVSVAAAVGSAHLSH